MSSTNFSNIQPSNSRLSRTVKYFFIILLYLIIFIFWNISKYEFVALFIFIIINIITNVLLYMDIVTSPKYYRPALIVAFCSMALAVTSNIIIFIWLVTTASNNETQEQRLNKTNRQMLNSYKSSSIAVNIFLFLWCVLFFIGKSNVPFFDNIGVFDFNNVTKKYAFNHVNLWGFIFKIILSCLLLGLSGYIVYVSDFLMNNDDKTIIENTPKPNISSSPVIYDYNAYNGVVSKFMDFFYSFNWRTINVQR